MKGKTRMAVVVAMATLLMALPAVVADNPTDPDGPTEATTVVTVANEAPKWNGTAAAYMPDDPDEADPPDVLEGANDGKAEFDPEESTNRLIEAWAVVTDNNGGDDVSSVNCSWLDPNEDVVYSGSGEVDSNTISNEVNITVKCNQNLTYNDLPGDWKVRFSVQDDDGAWTETNASVTFQYMQAAYMDLNGTEVSWGSLNLSATDQNATETIYVNNTGNGVIDLQIKGEDLTGFPDGNYAIGIGNVSVSNATSGSWQDYTDSYAAYTDGADVEVNSGVLMKHRLDVPSALPDQQYNGTISVQAEAGN